MDQPGPPRPTNLPEIEFTICGAGEHDDVEPRWRKRQPDASRAEGIPKTGAAKNRTFQPVGCTGLPVLKCVALRAGEVFLP